MTDEELAAMGIKRDEATHAERQAEFDATAKVVEMDMEQDQERPVKVG